DLYIDSVGCFAGEAHAVLHQDVLEFPVEFVTVPVAFADLGCAVRFFSEAARRQAAGIRAQAHGSPEFVHAFQFPQLKNYAIRSVRIEFGGIGIFQSAHVARELDHHGLHSQADSKIGNFVLARTADGVQHAVDAPPPESAGHENAIEAPQ